jgi:hypothetical protein
MSKQVEKFKKQLLEISEVVNSFKSEAVQVKIVDRFLDAMHEWDHADAENHDFLLKRNRKRTDADENGESETSPKKPGATKVLSQLLSTTYFNTPRSISEIATYCKDVHMSHFKTSELSGVLLKLAKESKLKRERNQENNRFEYVKAS